MEKALVRIIHTGITMNTEEENAEIIVSKLSVKYRFKKPGDTGSQTRETRFFLTKWDKDDKLIHCNREFKDSLVEKIEGVSFLGAGRLISSLYTKRYGDEFLLRMGERGNPEIQIGDVMKLGEEKPLTTPLKEAFEDALKNKEEKKEKKSKKTKE